MDKCNHNINIKLGFFCQFSEVVRGCKQNIIYFIYKDLQELVFLHIYLNYSSFLPNKNYIFFVWIKASISGSGMLYILAENGEKSGFAKKILFTKYCTGSRSYFLFLIELIVPEILIQFFRVNRTFLIGLQEFGIYHFSHDLRVFYAYSLLFPE